MPRVTVSKRLTSSSVSVRISLRSGRGAETASLGLVTRSLQSTPCLSALRSTMWTWRTVRGDIPESRSLPKANWICSGLSARRRDRPMNGISLRTHRS